MADNSGTALPHKIDFAISKDHFELIYLSCDLKTINCLLADHSIWIKFIFKFVRLLHKAGICSTCRSNYLQRLHIAMDIA